MEVTRILNEYYGSYDEDKRLCSRHGSVEFLTTMRYVEKYLQPGESLTYHITTGILSPEESQAMKDKIKSL